MSNTEIIFEPLEEQKVNITINQRTYLISARFSVGDSRKYIAELSKENNYKKAISIIVYDKITQVYNDECLSLQDIISTEDSAFVDYILATVAANKELQVIFDNLENDFVITEKFSIAYKSYMDLLLKRVGDAVSPLVEQCNSIVRNIDFSWMNKMQELLDKVRPTWINAIENMTRTAQQIAKAVRPFQQLAESITKTISNINIPSISEETKERWETSYRKWGKIGWPVLPNAPFDFFNEFPDDTKTANKIAMRYCDTKSMDDLFNNLRQQHLKKVDLESTIFCYKNRQYKACALLIFCLIDSKMIKLQPKSKNRAVGLKAVNKLKFQLNEKMNQEHFLMTALYQINLMTCLDTYFANGNNFIEEPDTINRNFVDHGMNTRTVRKRDCVQLFLALHNLLEFLDYLS